MLEPLTHTDRLRELVAEALVDASNPTLAEELGLAKPLSSTVPPHLVERRVEELYASIFASVNHKMTTDQQANKQSETEAKAADDKLSKEKPAALLTDVVRHVVTDELAERGITENTMAVDMGHHGTADAASKFVTSLKGPGNGKSPPAGAGAHDTQRRGRGKGKGNQHQRWPSHHQQQKAMPAWPDNSYYQRRSTNQRWPRAPGRATRKGGTSKGSLPSDSYGATTGKGKGY